MKRTEALEMETANYAALSRYYLLIGKRLNQEKLDFSKYPCLTFEKPDTDTFTALRLAYDAGRSGGVIPTVFNSADEAAVELFLKEKIKYLEIGEVIEQAMQAAPCIENPSIEDILEADAFARSFVYRKESK